MFKQLLTAATLASVFQLSLALAVDDYPTKPVSIVVGFKAGGGMDTLGRLVAEKLSEELAQNVTVENRPGAGGTIAAGYVASVKPDGYILYLGETSATIASETIGKVAYDPLKSFEPVAELAVVPLALVVNNGVEASTLEELVQLIKSKPGEFFYSTSGIGTLQHLAGEKLKTDLGLDVDVVHFQGGAPAIKAVISGEVQMGITSLNAASSQASGGKLKIIAVTTPEPVPGFESLQTVSAMVEGFNASPSQFIMAPAGTPKNIIKKLESALETSLQDQQLQSDLAKRGLVPGFVGSAGLAEKLPEMINTWTATARKAIGK